MLKERQIKRLLAEELTKGEVRGMIDDEFSTYLKSRDFKKAVREIAADVLEDLFANLYRKNTFWKNSVKNG